VTVSLQWINTPVGLLVTMLAVLRLTRFVVADAFPFGMLRDRVVEWANQRWGPYRRTYAPEPEDVEPAADDARALRVYDGTAPLAYLVTCYWCTGLYMSVACVLLASTGTWWMWAATPLAVSAVVGLLGTRD
jgi:hypothetical protein